MATIGKHSSTEERTHSWLWDGYFYLRVRVTCLTLRALPLGTQYHQCWHERACNELVQLGYQFFQFWPSFESSLEVFFRVLGRKNKWESLQNFQLLKYAQHRKRIPLPPQERMHQNSTSFIEYLLCTRLVLGTMDSKLNWTSSLPYEHPV